jgi:uncharacterized membrane protein
VTALLLAAAFFIKYAFDHDWIGPTARVVLGIIFGVALLVAGDRCIRRGMGALGQGLLGGGLGILYLSLYASSAFYELIPREAAFGGMALVTAAGMTLSVLHDALPICFLAVLGGMLTPVLLSTGRDQRDVLFTYLLVLDLGVLGVAWFRRWRSLDVLAFLGTALLFGGWYFEFYRPEAMLPTLGWLSAFYVVFLLLPFAYHLRQRQPIELERFLLALANALLAFGCAYAILAAEHERALGFIALGMAACYLLLGTWTRRRVAADVKSLFGFIALALLFLTIAVPLHLGLHGITLAWAAEAPVLAYLGYRYRYEPVRLAGFAVAVLAVIRLFAVHWPLHQALFRPVWNASFGSALSVPLAAGVMALVHERWSAQAGRTDRVMKLLSALAGAYLALVVLHAEIALWGTHSGHVYAARCMVPVLWAAGAVASLQAGLKTHSAPVRLAGLPMLIIATLLAGRAYGYDLDYAYPPLLNLRFTASAVVVLAVFAYPHLLRTRIGDLAGRDRKVAAIAWWAGVGILLCLLSVESYTWCMANVEDPTDARWMALMSISMVWAAYAGALLVVGFWRRVQRLRLTGLLLFLAAAAKLALMDIAGVKQIYRILAFFVVGLLMIGAAYLYHRAEQYLSASQGEGQ